MKNTKKNKQNNKHKLKQTNRARPGGQKHTLSMRVKHDLVWFCRVIVAVIVVTALCVVVVIVYCYRD